MSKKNTNTELLLNRDSRGRVTKRGRKRLEVKLPNKNKFIMADVQAVNPGRAIPALYSRLEQMGRMGIVKITNETTQTGKRGKPAKYIWKMGAWKAYQALRKSTKSKGDKLASVPAVDLTPAAEPVTA